MANGHKKTELQNLPACVAEFIKRVIKKMRYRRKVRLDVQAELAAHFEDELKEIVERLNLGSQVKFLGRVDHSELPLLFSEADIGVAVFAPIDLYAYSFPIKIVEYMAAGLPVIGTKIGEIEKIIQRYGVGKTISFSSDSFAEATIELFSNRVTFRNYVENAIKASREYDWKIMFSREFLAIKALA